MTTALRPRPQDMRRNLRRVAICTLLTTTGFGTRALGNDALVSVLACSQIEAHWRLLKDSAAKQPDGTLLVAGPVRAGEACIADARITGSFGVLVITGRLCGGGIQPLVDLVRRSRPQLREVEGSPHPGVIATYADTRYSIGFLRGIARPGQEPVPDDSVTSYMCSYQGSGPQ
jgi:hypothetical protein